jgi:hypothetical protein
MLAFLDQISYPLLLLIAGFMLIAPIFPMPHVAEKLIMLKNGTLRRPLDIFDLCFHLLPLLILGLKLLRDRF